MSEEERTLHTRYVEATIARRIYGRQSAERVAAIDEVGKLSDAIRRAKKAKR